MPFADDLYHAQSGWFFVCRVARLLIKQRGVCLCVCVRVARLLIKQRGSFVGVVAACVWGRLSDPFCDYRPEHA